MRLKALETKGKGVLLALIRPLLRGRLLEREILRDRPIQRILVVRQDERLGNLILITPFLEGLGNRMPQAHITALVSVRFGDILRNNPAVDTILSFDKRHFLWNPIRFARFVRALRRCRFDLAVDCGPVDGLSLNNALMTYLSGAPVRLGYLRGHSDTFLNLLAPRPVPESSEVEIHLNLLRFCFGQIPSSRPKVYLTAPEKEAAARVQDRWGLRQEDLLVGIHIGGRGQKRWPVERFASLAGQLIENHDVKVVIFWGPGEKELLKAIPEDHSKGLFLAPALEVRELASHIQRCDVFISCDTGPMHLALALERPTVAIFRQPNYERYGQRGVLNRVVFRPGGDVAEEDVLEELVPLLNGVQSDEVAG
jgi:ADP-heptose:LPS heptosyltransferase